MYIDRYRYTDEYMSGFIKIIIIIINDCSIPYIKDTGANFLFTQEMETVREKYIRKERKKKLCISITQGVFGCCFK